MSHWISKSVIVSLVLVALVAGAAAQARKGKGTKRYAGRPSQTTAATAQTPEDGVRRVTPAEAHAAVQKGRAIIVDVRGEDSYRAGHIKGALSIPINDVGSRAGELPRGKLIITYCA